MNTVEKIEWLDDINCELFEHNSTSDVVYQICPKYSHVLLLNNTIDYALSGISVRTISKKNNLQLIHDALFNVKMFHKIINFEHDELYKLAHLKCPFTAMAELLVKVRTLIVNIQEGNIPKRETFKHE